MNFTELVEQILQETTVSSCLGSNVGATASARSGDKYAPDDARRPSMLFKGTMSRFGTVSTKNKKNGKKRKR